MKNLVQNFFRFFGYELRKFNPYPNTFISIDILDYILFKFLRSKKNLYCVFVDYEEILKENIILKTFKRYKIKINYFKLLSKNKLKLLNKDKFNIIIFNKSSENLLKKVIQKNKFCPMIILNSDGLTNKSIYNCNILMLREKYDISKYWNYIIYLKES